MSLFINLTQRDDKGKKNILALKYTNDENKAGYKGF
jgi:hypothetical protein